MTKALATITTVAALAVPALAQGQTMQNDVKGHGGKNPCTKVIRNGRFVTPKRCQLTAAQQAFIRQGMLAAQNSPYVAHDDTK